MIKDTGFTRYRADCKAKKFYNINNGGTDMYYYNLHLQKCHVEGDEFATQLNQIYMNKDVFERIANDEIVVSLQAPVSEEMAIVFQRANIYLAPWLPNEYGLLVYDPANPDS